MNEMKNKKYHTMETIPKWPQKIPHYGNNSKMKKKKTTIWKQFQNEKTKNTTFHAMGTIPKRKKKNTTLWKQFQYLIVSSGAGTAYHSRESEFIPGY